MTNKWYRSITFAASRHLPVESANLCIALQATVENPYNHRVAQGIAEGAFAMCSPIAGAIFAGVIVLGPSALYAPWEAVRNTTSWLLRHGLSMIYKGCLGLSGGLIFLGLYGARPEMVGKGLVMGITLFGTKCLGDRFGSALFHQVGTWLTNATRPHAGAWHRTMHRLGMNMQSMHLDGAAASGLVLLAHSFDEIAGSVMSAQMLFT